MMLMLVTRAISQDPTLTFGGRTFPKDPAMVVCPTKALQEDMEYSQSLRIASTTTSIYQCNC